MTGEIPQRIPKKAGKKEKQSFHFAQLESKFGSWMELELLMTMDWRQLLSTAVFS